MKTAANGLEYKTVRLANGVEVMVLETIRSATNGLFLRVFKHDPRYTFLLKKP